MGFIRASHSICFISIYYVYQKFELQNDEHYFIEKRMKRSPVIGMKMTKLIFYELLRDVFFSLGKVSKIDVNI